MAAKLERRNSTGDLKDKKGVDRLKKEHFLKADSDQIDLQLLLQAVLDINDKLDKKNERTEREVASSAGGSATSNGRTTTATKDFDQRSTTSSTRSRPRSAIRYNDSKNPAPTERKNLSFSNVKVADIDRENQRLLGRITRTRGRVRPKSAVYSPQRVFTEPLRVQTAAEVNRSRFQRRVDAENHQILQRLQAIQPTKSLSKDHLSREAAAQKQFCKNASKGRPSSARSRTSSASSRLSRFGSESSLLTNDAASVTSSRMSSASRPRSGRRRTASSSKPVWEPGW